MLWNKGEGFTASDPQHHGTGIYCTYCIHSTVPAVKSCLHCEASLCDSHVRAHSKSAEHVLTEPTTPLGNRKCYVHHELLKYYCGEDGVCVCASCCLAGDHRGHKVETINEASEKKKEKLRNVLKKLTPKRKETEKKIQILQENRRAVQTQAAGERERMAAMFRDIKGWLDVLEKRVLGEISRQEEKISLQVCDLIQQLEIQKDELSKKMNQIEKMCSMVDPLTVLKDCQLEAAAFYVAVEGKDVRERDDRRVCAVGDLDMGLVLQTLHTGLDNVNRVIYGNIYGEEATTVLLDINTAANEVALSKDRKTVYLSQANQNHSNTPERFQVCPQVLSTRSFPTGRYYWDVEGSESGGWRVGVAYPSIARNGDHSCIGENRLSWCLCQWGQKYSVIHNNKEVLLSHKASCSRIRISLDYEAGLLSFYELSDPIRHLHTFTATFTEPLHAALWVGWGNSCVGIIS
ncbi:hypothetical protein GDO86_014601 [Hymenochirus boettgeri]|uniref:Uncharacterized protein n=1 Tax=Hymenochirus boettgeri TaxID=247094 RepID=A0A8T2JUM1_9PIPI|nr:hypothetical protein GDO86_014601 [Hymenochirus boettgeri]